MDRPAPSRTVRILTTALAGAAVLAAATGVGAPAAQAATTATVPCGARATAAKFRAVDGDTNAYFTAPSGTFESGTPGWTLSSASVVLGNESRFVNGITHVRSLQVLRGGKAVSPVFCNQFGERSIRFFYKGTVGARVHLHIDVTNSATDNSSTLDWETTVPLLGWGVANGIPVPDLYSQGYENLQLTFSAVGGAVAVDDVEIDPFKPL
jgi:hypothetical protein